MFLWGQAVKASHERPNGDEAREESPSSVSAPLIAERSVCASCGVALIRKMKEPPCADES